MTTIPMPCGKCGQPHAKCASHKRDGTPCGQRPMKGQRVCKMHGGMAPKALAAAARRLAEAEAAEAVATYGLPIDISPTEALLEEVRWTAGHVAWLRARVREVEQSKLTFGITEQKLDPQGGKTTKAESVPNAWLVLYNRERTHLLAVTTAAIRAGVEERIVRLAERDGHTLVEVIRGVLAELELTEDQQAKVSTVVPRHLRLVSGGAAA